MANNTHSLPEPQLTQVLDWIHFGDAGEDERADDAIVKLTSATGRPICSLNAAWLKALAVASVEGKQSGPGSTEDERKALLQLLDAMPALAPQATGLSHAMRLVLLDALRYRDQRTAAAPDGHPARRAVVDAIAAYVGPTPYAETLADRMFRLFETSPSAPTCAPSIDTILLRLEDAMDACCDQPLNAARMTLTRSWREILTADLPVPSGGPMRQQRGCECHGADECPAAHPPTSPEDVPPEKARWCPTKITPGEAPRG